MLLDIFAQTMFHNSAKEAAKNECLFYLQLIVLGIEIHIITVQYLCAEWSRQKKRGKVLYNMIRI